MYNSTLHVSDIGKKLIQGFESCKLTAYKDSGGIFTIGWGSTSIAGKPVREGLVITQKQADNQFSSDLVRFELMVLERVKRVLFQGEFDAATSFAYNAGTMYKTTSGTWQHFLLWDKINKRVTSDEMRLYWETLAITAGGKLVDGLQRRRKAEAHLYLTGELDFFG